MDLDKYKHIKVKSLTEHIEEKLIINQQVDEKLLINKNLKVDNEFDDIIFNFLISDKRLNLAKNAISTFLCKYNIYDIMKYDINNVDFFMGGYGYYRYELARKLGIDIKEAPTELQLDSKHAYVSNIWQKIDNNSNIKRIVSLRSLDNKKFILYYWDNVCDAAKWCLFDKDNIK